MTLWSGRVDTEVAQAVWNFLRADDAELLPYDCLATRVHARRLHEGGLLSDSELADVETALDWIAVEGGTEPDDEDVHSTIERLLGTVGRKIHAGRSRNDQVAAALRLYVADACLEAARQFYRGRPFVRVIDKPPHTKWATGSNLVYVSYAADPQRGLIIALGAVDNLGKGAAGQAVQNANLMLGLDEVAGLNGAPLWP